ncbi:MAG: CvpA family protein [Rubricoccaceae bacterium]
MNALDGFLAAALALGVWRGMRTGALRQAVGTAGLFVAFLAGVTLMAPVGELLVLSLRVSERTAPVLGFLATFLAFLMGLYGAAFALRTALDRLRLSGIDRLGGGAIGGLRAAFGLSVLLLVTGFAPGGERPLLIGAETRAASLLYAPVEAIAPETWAVVRRVTPGVQRVLTEKFSTWHAGTPRAPDAASGPSR